MQILRMNNKIQASLNGNSKSLEMQTDNRSTHHRNHPLGIPMEEVAVEVAEEEVAEEGAAEEDYPCQQDQACSLHTDELLTQNS
jgi:hypothetical protein